MSTFKINLSKGDVINLEKVDETNELEEINVGMGWLVADKSKKSSITREVSRPVKGFFNWLRGVFGAEQVMETVTENIPLPKSQYDYDLDASCYVSGVRGQNLVYFGYKDIAGIHHGGDNLVGGTGNSDDETINIQLNQVSKSAKKIIIFMNIYQASSRRQSFACLENAYLRIYNVKTKKELCRYDLAKLDPTATALVLGELYKEDGKWNFKAIGDCYKADHPSEMVRYFK